MTDHNYTCLHGGDSGSVLCASAHGGTLALTRDQFRAVMRRPGLYRIMAIANNYRLITEVYSSLVDKGTKSSLLVGSPLICRQRKQTADQILNCFVVLDVHDSVSNTWHVMDSNLYNNYLLLRTYLEEGVSDLTRTIYKHHCLKPAFDFMGIHDLEPVLATIALIVEPRWYVNIARPYRLSSFERYFGLLPKQFNRFWECSNVLSDDNKFQRTACLAKLVHAMDRNNFVLQDLETGPDGPSTTLKACRRVLSFVVRNWLSSLTFSTYFDPALFFKQTDARNAYLRRFRE